MQRCSPVLKRGFNRGSGKCTYKVQIYNINGCVCVVYPVKDLCGRRMEKMSRNEMKVFREIGTEITTVGTGSKHFQLTPLTGYYVLTL